jgi:transcriptional regulator of acetoin/glycerol metabolism
VTAAARRACVTLYEAGWYVATVAALAGVHHTTVWRALRREGVAARGRWG